MKNIKDKYWLIIVAVVLVVCTGVVFVVLLTDSDNGYNLASGENITSSDLSDDELGITGWEPNDGGYSTSGYTGDGEDNYLRSEGFTLAENESDILGGDGNNAGGSSGINGTDSAGAANINGNSTGNGSSNSGSSNDGSSSDGYSNNGSSNNGSSNNDSSNGGSSDNNGNSAKSGLASIDDDIEDLLNGIPDANVDSTTGSTGGSSKLPAGAVDDELEGFVPDDDAASHLPKGDDSNTSSLTPSLEIVTDDNTCASPSPSASQGKTPTPTQSAKASPTPSSAKPTASPTLIEENKNDDSDSNNDDKKHIYDASSGTVIEFPEIPIR